MRTYHHIIENVSLSYFFENNLINIFYQEEENGTVTAEMQIPTNLFVSNPNFVLERQNFTEDQAAIPLANQPLFLSDLTLQEIKDDSDKIKEEQTTTGFFYTLKIPKNNINGLQENLSERLIITKRSSGNWNLPNLGNYFFVGNLVRLKSYIFQEGTTIPLSYLLYVNSVEKTDESFIIKFKDFQYKLEQVPTRFVTRESRSLLDFMKSFIIPQILEFTDVSYIFLSKSVHDTMKKSNIGRYRSNTASYNRFFLQFMSDYVINYAYNDLAEPLGGLVFIFGERRVLDYQQLPINLKTFTSSDIKGPSVFSPVYQSFTEVGIKKQWNDNNPVIVKIVSVQEQLNSIKNTKKPTEVIYGDRSALSSDTGSGKILTVKVPGLSEESMKNKAILLYNQYKFLSPENSFISKNFFIRRQILNFITTDNFYETGYYYIRQISYKFDTEGFECQMKTGARFVNFQDMLKVLDNTRIVSLTPE